MKLSLLFPDRAPSLLRVAWRAGSTRSLEHRRGHGVELLLELVAALNAHDRRTRGHSERVRAFSDLLADELELPTSDRERLRWAGLLHDIGKLTVDPRILNKADGLDDDEWDALRAHPTEGARIAAPLLDWLGPYADAIEQHHERWDGSGYPKGLRREDSVLARGSSPWPTATTR